MINDTTLQPGATVYVAPRCDNYRFPAAMRVCEFVVVKRLEGGYQVHDPVNLPEFDQFRFDDLCYMSGDKKAVARALRDDVIRFVCDVRQTEAELNVLTVALTAIIHGDS